MSARRSTRTPRSLPSASAASSMSWIWPRPWMVLCAFSVRSSTQRTGRPCFLASAMHEQLVGVDVELRAEPAADRRRDDPDLLLGEAERDRRHHLEDVGDLGGRVERDVAAERLGHRRAGPGLHRHRDEPLLHVALLDHVGRVGEGPLDRVVVEVELPRVGDVGAEVVVDDRRVGAGVLEVGDRRQRVVLDLDGLERVAGRGRASRPPPRPRRRRRSRPCPPRAGRWGGLFMSSVTGQAHGIGLAHASARSAPE